ncbi:sigma-70 family RNA polymerase sigma factor [Kitasatospora sp. NPDC085464]|uniref:sigma-70 family RNA polymerase sigma factor n=1 Tax=Kitasatospora sp. NPDC085464 TaxID=3364063 RepID=UPI0037C8C0C6
MDALRDQDTDESGSALVDRIGDCDPGIELAEFRAAVRPLLADLPRREQTVLKLRFWDGWTQSEIADRIGVSQMHVSRLLAATLTRLREQLEDRDAPGWSDDPDMLAGPDGNHHDDLGGPHREPGTTGTPV